MKYPYYIFPVIVLEKIKLKGEPQSQAKLQEKDLLAIRSIDFFRPKARRSDCYYRRYLGSLAAQGRRIHCCSAAMLGHWRQAACCLPCLLSKAPGHLSLQLSPLAMGPAPALGG